ncbi:NAD(P)-binding protein [Novosphingobium sp. FSW06-99]|uniref:NAD(P)-binding protein n=1 Tax=Novosphingobium sp. FSW06-99 TaxID=1739113 RepID=UPI00076C19C7|nr:NAD(P)-binding protein [Novosphingobium sp. FSW06-99]KUR75914.1 twin-arginine translocation pathway signal protein [Novosphingobium sp. FSW06-99]
MKGELTRRQWIAGSAGLGGALALGGCATAPVWPGTLDGADFTRGHALRDRRFPAPAGPEQRARLVIAGGGVAGLAAGWRLRDAGFDDFVLLELEDRSGGNARSGRNAISAYPLGAHYLPIPNREAGALRRMLGQFGMIVGTGADGAPVYDPYQVCADLDERLFWRGAWQEGLFPQSGLSANERDQHAAFEAEMARLTDAIGRDGKPAFAVPLACSSADPAFTALDRVSFAAWLDQRGWTSAPLRAYVRYCCRDDYGTEPEQVSAWAGVHYFASRRGWTAEDARERELTWPEGNGRLAALMAAHIGDRIQPAHTVFGARQDGQSALITAFDHHAGHSVQIRADVAILAMPHFVATRIGPDNGTPGTFSYAPWVVANVSTRHHPQGVGVPLAWDNVSAGSDSLGYVVATHQTNSDNDGPTVLTWYMPLSAMPPAQARHVMQDRTLAQWQAIIADDLIALHPDLAEAITRIDVWRWGHAMIRPTPGFLTDPARIAAQNAPAPLLRAHSDLSGMSIFEEAHYHGVRAAEAAMHHLGHPFDSVLA